MWRKRERRWIWSMAEPLWTSAAIASATGGAAVGGGFSASGVSIDTRTLQPGDLFVALAGARDGHAFVDPALSAGAAGALVSRPVAGPHVRVADSLSALEALGVAARARAAGARRGAITGSVGKTTLTQAVMAGLTLAGPAHSSVKSYNNHIGVPLTLARMPSNTQRAIFEIGMNHAEEIRPLSRMVRPHAALVTMVGPVHTENFADGEAGVARAKAEIFDGLEPGGVGILNADNRWFETLKAAAMTRGAKLRVFGSSAGCDARLTGFEAAHGGAVADAEIDGRAVRIRLAQSGLHWGLSSLAVLLMLDALDVEVETGLAALADFAPLDGRGAEARVVGPNGAFTLIDESYNANPVSMASTIATLGARQGVERRVAVLTDMLELGPEAEAFHAGLAAPLADARIDVVFCAGPLMKSLWDALPPTRRGGYAQNAAELAPRVVDALREGDVVMVKGSNGSRAGLIAQTLRALDQTSRRPGETG
jgi:UDP-N-acetylmuramoyl-tripeptide--D-alanyl-D-alanine ligase